MRSRLPRTGLALVLGFLAVASSVDAAVRTPTERIAEVRRLFDQGRYRESDSLGTLLVADLRKQPEVPKAVLADALIALQVARSANGKPTAPETIALAEEAVSLTESDSTRDESALAKSLYYLARTYDIAGRKSEAVPKFEHAVQITERVEGKTGATLARQLIGYGNCLRDLGRATEAATQFRRSLEILRKEAKLDSLNIGRDLNGLAIASYILGDYNSSADLFSQALTHYTTALGPEHPLTAMVLDNSGNTAQLLGDFEKARALHEQSIELLERRLGPDHPLVAQGRENLGALLFQMGEYRESREELEAAVGIYERTRGAGDADVAGPLANLARTLDVLGDSEGAGRVLDRALTIRGKELPADHPLIAQSLVALADHKIEMGEARQALPLLERAFGILTRKSGPDHIEVAEVLRSRGRATSALGDLAEAERAFAGALDIQEKQLQPDHPQIASSLVDLAVVRSIRGEQVGVRDSLARALAIQERSLGPRNPELATTLHHLAKARGASGDTTAFADAARGAGIRRRNLEITTRSLPERLALRCAAVSSEDLDLTVALAIQAPSREHLTNAWDEVIRWRGMVLEEIAARHQEVAGSKDPELLSMGDSLASASQRLAHLSLEPPNDEFTSYRVRLEQAAREKDRLESALAERVLSVRAERRRRAIGYEQVVRALPADAALVAYTRADLECVTERISAPRSEAMIALVRYAGRTSVVKLGAAPAIDSRVEQWRALASKEPALGSDARAEEDACRRAGAALRAAVWDPVASRFAGAKRVFLVPDGSLHLINFAALPTGSSRYLLETGPLIQVLAAERDLVREAPPQLGSGLLAMGGIDYSNEPGSKQSTASSRYRGQQPECEGLSKMQFGPLDGTAGEIDDVIRSWRASSAQGVVERLTGPDATEAAFKSEAPGKRVVHVATHGFFLGSDCDATRNRGGSTRELPRVLGDNPLVLSGLALAGANQRQRTLPGAEDGILTSEEIGSLDLSGAEWVVLSACETGLGVLQAGEGVFGLRRAFAVAGARDVITSLWRVNDVAARGWMRELYKGRARGLDAAAAAAEASRARLEERRKANRDTHPATWAAFVAAGP